MKVGVGKLGVANGNRGGGAGIARRQTVPLLCRQPTFLLGVVSSLNSSNQSNRKLYACERKLEERHLELTDVLTASKQENNVTYNSIVFHG